MNAITKFFILFIFIVLNFRSIAQQGSDSLLYRFNFYDKDVQHPIDVEIEMCGTQKGGVYQYKSKGGIFEIKLVDGREYKFWISKRAPDRGGFAEFKLKVNKNNLVNQRNIFLNMRLANLPYPQFHFNRNMDSISKSDSTFERIIDVYRRVLDGNPTLILEVVGFASSDEINRNKLAEQRAQFIYKSLMLHKVNPERLLVTTTEYHPFLIMDDESPFPYKTLLTEEFIISLPKDEKEKALALNRRVSLRIHQ